MSAPPQHLGLDQRIAQLRRRAAHDSQNTDVREVVRLRANDACEYCLLPTTGKFEIEHIIPPRLWDDYVAGRIRSVRLRRRRRGPHHIDNYAWSCPFCNRAKSGRASHHVGRDAIRFFDPRSDRWPDHFVFPAATGHIAILGVTLVGRVTAGPGGLDFNAGGAEVFLVTRHLVIRQGEYPPAWARSAYGV